MSKATRNIKFRLYPSASQTRTLLDWLDLHRELYNAALEERRAAYHRSAITLTYNQQQNELPAVKAVRPDLIPLGSHALQETVRRVDRAYKAFFRRIKAGEKPGFPRFKGRNRFDSFTRESHTQKPDPFLPGDNLEPRKERQAKGRSQPVDAGCKHRAVFFHAGLQSGRGWWPAGKSGHCARCGNHVPKTLSDRTHDCPRCGFVAHRDHNAALNILRLGLAQAGREPSEVWRDRVAGPAKHETASRCQQGGR